MNMSYYHQESWLPMMRSITKEKFFYDPYCVQLYLYLYLSAKRHEDMFGKNPLLRGQLETTQSELSEFLKVPRQVLRSRLKTLEDLGYIVVRANHRRSTVITVRMFDNLLGVVKTNQGGWVKLYDEITGCDFFVSAKAVVVYVTLLSLQRMEAPVKISMRNFAKECQLTIRDVASAIKKLQREDIISCQCKVGHGKMEIGFKNRGLCLPEEDEIEALEAPKIQPTGNQDPTKTQPRPNQVTTNEDIIDGDSLICDVTYCKTNSYSASQPSDNQQKTKEKLSKNQARSVLEPTESALARDTYLNENREREREEREIRESSPSLSQRDFKNFSDQDNERSYAERLKQNRTWCDLMCRKFGYSGINVVIDKLDDFLLDIACTGKTHRSLQDFQSHFVSCLKIEQQSHQTYIRTKNFKKDEITERRSLAWSNRRGTEPSATCAQDYVASFSAFNIKS